ncbi:alpha/beta fold hydrolase [Candidatus Thiothrix sp. Deng01]|uniref:Proline iminopeptidase n=1 Tax=Candidatus Thiothrix phosphatis TaxID=3112415 RepID=A0ABU6CUL3_9GAMM|nr:alpha/beta fold hydrolase [Candidatus Thiothrix sp. Deng01]MEB4590459.1 alpha/beta fold hydrolase [Candidatus Thiothrix sp. Deng01]
MKKLIWALAGSLVVLSLLGIVSIHHFAPVSLVESISANGARFTPVDCWFTIGEGVRAQCGWLYTAPAAGKTHSAFKLPVIVMQYQGLDRQPDPVVYLAGGPGAPAGLERKAVEGYWLGWFQQKAGLKRDLVLFDQRGGGISRPDMECDGYRELSASILSQPGTPQENARRYREVARQCHGQLQQRGLPLDELGTVYSAGDVNDLMQLLGYAQWNLWGVSYGTRLAFEVQRRYPDKVRSMSLDSVYPPGEHLFRAWPDLLQGSLQRLFDFCQADNQCAMENGDLGARYQHLMAQLREHPLEIPVAGLHLGNLQELQLNDETLLAILFDSQYMSGSLREMAGMIRLLDEGRPDRAMGFIQHYLRQQFDASFREAAYWSVECRDNPPIARAEREAKINALPGLRDYLPYDYDLCDIWAADADGSLRLQDVAAPRQTPTLLLAGQDDPITPAAWATKVAKQGFAEHMAYLFRFEGISHSVMDNKPCAADLFVSFINAPDQRPSADCRRSFRDSEKGPLHSQGIS